MSLSLAGEPAGAQREAFREMLGLQDGTLRLGARWGALVDARFALVTSRIGVRRSFSRHGEARDCAHECLQIGMLRVAEDVLARSRARRSPLRYITRTSSATSGHDTEIVRDEQHRHAGLALQLLDQLKDLRLRGHVQRRGRLVRDQQIRPEISAMAIMARCRRPPESSYG